MPRLLWPSWLWMTMSGTPSCAISTAWAGAFVAAGNAGERLRSPACDAARHARRRATSSSAGRAVDDAEQLGDRELEAHIDPTLQVLPGSLVHTDLAPAPALAAAHEQGPATLVEVGLVERQRLVNPQARAPQHDDQPAQAATVAPVAGSAHDRDDLLDGRRVGRVAATPCFVADGRRGTPAAWRATADDQRHRAAL